ncbi:AcrR family transcriptional regulator [Bombiscardovia apis]|uniref:AcrR family transcriptional regulator n=1 Tax=Bombiscardovia apis TaxID=2932182 RepID=A0ABM8BCZ9_9BIFI|nr:TetR/AcrR family transcriptional regulator [Bombiscardovia apis]BDR54576.1 AcrR family transcriptional regulator [Bombiscardovia apis]
MARNAHPEETVQTILDVATELFLSKGYDNTSMQDIINNLGGLSKGAIYHHFASKEDLFEAVVNRLFAKVSPHRQSKWQAQFQELVAGHTSRQRNADEPSEQASEEIEARNESDNGLERMQDIHSTQVVAPELEAIAPLIASFDPRLNPKLIGMQFTGLLDAAPKVIAPILERGNEDGSLQVQHPQQVAEVQMLLSNMWLYPLFQPGNSEELHARADVYFTILRALGVPIEDRGLSDLLASYGSTNQSEEAQPKQTRPSTTHRNNQ